MATVRELLRAAPAAVARRDAEVLLGHCLHKSRAWLFGWPEAGVDAAAEHRYRELLAARARGEPVAYLVGEREFWSLPLAVGPATLIPRPDTEILVEWALQCPLPTESTVLDLGTGAGAIALALAAERETWSVTGVDNSAAALDVARGNAERLGLGRVQFLLSDWFGSVRGRRYHLLVANPPYIAPEDPHLRRGDVRFEPTGALVAADGGLADLAQITSGARAHLHPQGWLLLEHGYQQGAAVRGMLHDAGFEQVQTRADLAGRERVTGGCAGA